jgi:hypothetical protein
MIKNAMGDRAGARASVQMALDINPRFSIRYASEAEAFVRE